MIDVNKTTVMLIFYLLKMIVLCVLIYICPIFCAQYVIDIVVTLGAIWYIGRIKAILVTTDGLIHS